MAATIVISEFRASCRRIRCRPVLSSYYSLGSLQRCSHTSHTSHSPLHRYREVVEMTRRRIHGNGDSADKAKSPTTGVIGERERDDRHASEPSSPTHTHSHGIFGGHPHSHSHDHADHDHGGGLIETLQSGGVHPFPFTYRILECSQIHILPNGSPSPFLFAVSRIKYREGDRGSRVTLVGLGANIILTSAKGAAGWYMNSAALLADAGHSLSGKYVPQLSVFLSAVLRYMSLPLEGGGARGRLYCTPLAAPM